MAITDDFNRADSGSLGANWTEVVHGLQIASNYALSVSEGTYQFAYYSGSAWGNDQTAEVTIGTTITQLGPCVRLTGSVTGYFAIITAGDSWIYRMDGLGSFSLIQNTGGSWATGDVAKLEITGTTLKLYKNGVQQGTNSTDATYSTGNAGIMSRNTTSLINSWTGTGETGGGATSYTFTGPTSGVVNSASTDFTVTPDGDATGITVTPATDGSGSFTPSSVTFTGSGAETFTYTPTSTTGSPHTLSATDDGGLTDPAPIDYTVLTGTIAVTTPVQYQSYQRDGSDEADIAIAGTYTGSPTAIEASFNGGSYATIDGSPSGGTYSGTLSNQAAGQGTLTVRFTNDTGVTATKTYITITDIFVFAGDSRADGRLTNAQTYSGTGRMPCYRQDDAWAHGDPADSGATNGTICPLIANLYSALHSRPCAFITCGTGSSDVAGSHDEWAKGNSAYTEMDAQITGAGTNGVKAGIFLLGPNAIVDASTISQATYNAALDQLASDFASDFTSSASSSPKIFVDVCGEVGTGSPPDRRLAEDNIRQAVIEAWGNNSQIPGGPVLIDQDYSDDVHFVSDAQALVVAKRYWAAIENSLFSGTYSRGPRVSGSIALDSSKTLITITFDRDLASGSTYGGFRVEDSGTPATIVAASRAATRRVVIEVSSVLSAAANVAVSFGSNDDAKGQTVPTSTALTLPDSSTVTLPAEPFVDTGVVAEGSGGGAGLFGGIFSSPVIRAV